MTTDSREGINNDSSADSVGRDDSSSKLYIVGIGASAGGLEALESLFEHMPSSTGMAFVIVQHLSPDFKSHMGELLARRTRISIHQVEDRMRVEPDNIYLMPARKEMVISGGQLLLTDKDPQQQLSLPIDGFFRSLAGDARNRAIGIILSGTGSDGSRGICDIAAAGGLVICQSEDSAKFDGMPLSAQETGVVDLILPPEAIPEALLAHLKGAGASGCETSPLIPVEPRDDLDRIIKLLRSEYGIDFTNYKPSTVIRRTERRLALGDSQDMSQYVDRLENNPAELNSLYKDLLIGVTEFFRDAEAFQKLEEEVIPEILAERKPGESIRAWVAGCATGEEAYSLGILFSEAIERRGIPCDVKIFATDMHPASLEFASAGVYPQASLAGVSDERRDRFFIETQDGYQVNGDLRRKIVFAPHNVITDAPFTKLDLISCRNLLIYLQPLAQKKVLSLFHFSLTTRGYLFLGASETPGELADEFDTLDMHWKLYRKIRDVRLPTDMRLRLAANTGPGPLRYDLPSRDVSSRSRSLNETYERLLTRYVPPGFLVDNEFRLLHTFGGAERLLKIRGGTPPVTLLDMLDESLKTPVSGALHHALKDESPVRYSGLSFVTEEGRKRCRIVVEPLISRRTRDVQILVLIEELKETVHDANEVGKEFDVEEMSRDHIDSLESELRYTKENLQATIEELETSNEELQATNEELVASNEELQSTNEELHSVNEELYTVNGEHQRKISELTEMTNDLDNLLDSSEIGVVFLDQNLCIRKFTHRMSDLFQIERRDLGRRINRFTHSILDEHLLEDAVEVLQEGRPIEREVQDASGVHYFLRILPYKTDGETSGVVLTLINIENLKHGEEAVAQLSAIVESSHDAIIGKDLEGRITSWNQGAEALYGYTAKEVVGKSIAILTTDSRRDEYQGFLERIRSGESIPPLETVRRRKDGSLVDVSLRISPIRNGHGQVIGASAISRDITELKRVRRDLERALKRRDRFLAMLSHELRNPLGAMQNAADILNTESVDEDQVTMAREVIVRQSAQMTRLLDDLLDASRITEGKIRIEKRTFDIRDTVDDVVSVLEPSLSRRSQRLEIQRPQEPLLVYADPIRIQQIQVNLLNNASKYSPEGELITLKLAREGDEAVICVKDNGIGISEELQQQIFDPFVQSNDTMGLADGGMGIGLTLVRALVNSHHGKVSVFSDGEGRGSEFVVRLPLAEDGSEQDRADPEEKGSEEASIRRTIVLVEDNPDNRMVLSTLLEMEGHTVSVAEDGRSGIELILSERPEIALIDLGLPDFDGCEVAGRVRDKLTREQTLLVALTGYGREQDMNRTRLAGFDAHIVKPLDRKKLAQVLSGNRDELAHDASDRKSCGGLD